MATFFLPAGPPTDEMDAIHKRLHELNPELKDIKSIEEIASEIKRDISGKHTVVFVSPNISPAGLDNLINISERYRERVFFVLVSNDISAADYKRLVRSGGADWVAAQGPLTELQEIINGQSAPPPTTTASPARVSKPTVVSFLPCRGGVGNTTIALETALHIKLAKATRNWKVCYVDLDFQTSHVCDFLDIEPRLRIQEIFERPERLDEKLFGALVSEHPCGLAVLASPRSTVDPCRINVAALDGLMDLVLRNYDFVIIDLPPFWFEWTRPTIENSDAIVVAGINTVPCLRQLRATLDEVEATKSRNVVVAINRIARGLFGGVKRARHVKTVLPEETVFYVQEDLGSVDRVNAGTPAMLSGRSRFKKDIVRLSAYCAGVKGKGPVTK